MSLAPLTEAHLLVQVHVGAALAAFLLGGYQMAARKGTALHRKAGWAWVLLMGLVAASSAGIVSSHPRLGPCGWIHILSASTLVMLPLGVLHARRRWIRAHRLTMMGLFFGGLVVTGLFTLLPGRILHQVVFAG